LNLFLPALVFAAPVASISASQLNTNITIGSTYQLSALALDASGWPVSPQPALTWSSSDTAVGTVSATGLFTAVSLGVTTITVSDGTVSGTVAMTVSSVVPPVLVSIKVAPLNSIVLAGATQQFTATAYDSSSIIPSATQPVFAWSTSDSAVGTIDASGLFAAVAPGVVTVTASASGINGTANVTVNPAGGPTFATITISSVNGAGAFGANIPLGYTVQLQATAWDASGFNRVNPQPAFTWASSDTAVATIDATGLFRAVGFGAVTITASSQGVSRSISTIVGQGFAINSSAGANGAITPLGNTIVAPGANQGYTITPNAGYNVADVLVDGVSVGAVSNYMFTNVSAAHSISASFVQAPVAVPNLVAGWNLVGWTGNSSATADSIGLANAGVDVISKWDAASQLWVSHIVNFPLNNFVVNPGDGIFIHKI